MVKHRIKKVMLRDEYLFFDKTNAPNKTNDKLLTKGGTDVIFINACTPTFEEIIAFPDLEYITTVKFEPQIALQYSAQAHDSVRRTQLSSPQSYQQVLPLHREPAGSYMD